MVDIGVLIVDANGDVILDANFFALGEGGGVVDTDLELATAPVISGTASYGGILSSTTGQWASVFPILYYLYQWRRNGENIYGANSSTYQVVMADVGQDITCVVTATNGFHIKSGTSNTLRISGRRANTTKRRLHERLDWRWFKAPG